MIYLIINEILLLVKKVKLKKLLNYSFSYAAISFNKLITIWLFIYVSSMPNNTNNFQNNI